MMEVFIVVKQGVYRHEIVGSFATLTEAKAAAEIAIGREVDDYHDFEIVRCVVGVLAESNSSEELVASLSRKIPNSTSRKSPLRWGNSDGRPAETTRLLWS